MNNKKILIASGIILVAFFALFYQLNTLVTDEDDLAYNPEFNEEISEINYETDSSVTFQNREESYPGINLFNRRNVASVKLMDNDGTVHHE